MMDPRAVLTTAYLFIPASCLTDIVTSYLPHWNSTRAWIIARPLTGLAETFCQYVMEVESGGGSNKPEPDPEAQGVIFITDGQLSLTINGTEFELSEGGYAYIPPSTNWTVHNKAAQPARFHWIRKCYEAVEGIDSPEPIVTNEKDVAPISMPDTEGKWATTRFVEPSDMRHDMHVNIVTFKPGGLIPFPETHVMEHGLYVLQGKASYKLNQDWIEVEAGDFMWLRAFCPQACYAAGTEDFRYLLYKDVNRHPKLSL